MGFNSGFKGLKTRCRIMICFLWKNSSICSVNSHEPDDRDSVSGRNRCIFFRHLLPIVSGAHLASCSNTGGSLPGATVIYIGGVKEIHKSHPKWEGNKFYGLQNYSLVQQWYINIHIWLLILFMLWTKRAHARTHRHKTLK